MQDVERQKIADFKKRFLPSSLPDEVRASGNFKTGSEVNYQQEMQLEQQQQRAPATGGRYSGQQQQQMQIAQGGMA